MAEYIERKALCEAFDNADADIAEEYEDGVCDWGFGRQNILEVINSVPAVDVAPVRNGYWRAFTCPQYRGLNDYGDPIFKDGVVYHCSKCGRKTVIKENYCPNCGAKMDLEVSDVKC